MLRQAASAQAPSRNPTSQRKPAPAAPVTTLPATGAGSNDERNSLLGVTALGAAAALLAAKKLRETPEA